MQYAAGTVVGILALLGIAREYFLQKDRKDLRELLENANVTEGIDKMTDVYTHAKDEVTMLNKARVDAADAVRRATNTPERVEHERTLKETLRMWERAVESRDRAWQGLEDAQLNLMEINRITAEAAARERIAVGQAKKREEAKEQKQEQP